ncbi:sensor histidine kinase [Halomonas sp. CH40]
MIRQRLLGAFLHVVIFIYLTVGSGTSIAAEPPVINEHLNLLDYISFYVDPTGEATFEQVSKGSLANAFIPTDEAGHSINAGFTTAAYWVRVDPAFVRAQQGREWLLELGYYYLNDVRAYIGDQPMIQTGSLYPFDSRPVPHRHYVFPIDEKVADDRILLRIETDQIMTLLLNAWDVSTFTLATQRDAWTKVLYFGGLLSLVLFNLMLFSVLRERSFLLYSLFTLSIGMTVAASNGFARMGLWPEWLLWDHIAEMVFYCVAGTLGVLFTQTFLRTSVYARGFYHAMSGFAVGYLVFLALIVWGAVVHQTLIRIWTPLVIFILISGVVVLWSAIVVYFRGHQAARFFILAWAVLWIGGLIAVLRGFELLPTNIFTVYAIQICSALEMILLALSLADRMHLDRQAKERTQQALIESEQRRLAVLSVSEKRLEKEVSQRTAELSTALDTERLLRARHQRLNAMISHEFRNPLAIISSQISLYHKEHARGIHNMTKRLRAIESATQRLQVLVQQWLRSDRLHHSELIPQKQPLELAAYLDEQRAMLQQLHMHHSLCIEIDDQPVWVKVDAELLDAVVFNLVENACKYSPAGTTVTIKLRAMEMYADIAIIDQGVGIPEHQQEMIWDDYCRGEAQRLASGLGLGLSFVRRIVDLHQGDIVLESVFGQGSCFCTRWPLLDDMST